MNTGNINRHSTVVLTHMQNKKRHHVYDVYYSFFDKYKGHNQVVSTLVLYFGGPEFKYEPEDWLL